MGVGKTGNKKLPPDDYIIDYQYADTDCLKIEKIALTLLEHALKPDFVTFHGHQYPDYPIDVLWFYHNDYYKIIDTIKNCGWTPKIEKVKEFCNQILQFNKPYYDILTNCITVYNNIINEEIAPCKLTIYETSMIHALLMKYQNISDPKQIKLIDKLPTSTEEFFNLYSI
jgi:hypothetical protein